MKCYLTCLLFLADAILAVLPRKPTLSHLHAQLLSVRCDAVLLRRALMSIRLAAQLNDRREMHAETLQEEVIFWTAFELGYRMNRHGVEHWLLTRCLFRITREGEITLPASWLNGWRCGKNEAYNECMLREAAGDYPEDVDMSEVHGDS
ncbi:hypothetical protein [Klebsiella aerogenes]|uniref:Uncharacterized protein n=1 Tax=Klebsiella aerogenes TaxID=548 RepID=A0AAP9R1P5_KLEAE|nr:hypothetical protein [Klebsiella aerogenes]QMR42933.1 hypothetical protein HV331_25835 [Klebsiella aerogenes]